jgi:putative nucleotidyltransferase with HDIG domain
MNKKDALKLLEEKISNKNLIKHSLAVEAVMRELADHLGEDREIWGLAGLLHDLDFERTADDPEKHGFLTAQWLEPLDIPRKIIQLILAHNSDHLNIERKSVGEKAIYAADPLAGLIVAAALITPDKKIKSLEESSVVKRFNTPKFSQSINRDQIRTCEDIGLSLEEFISISLKAMQKVNRELGL